MRTPVEELGIETTSAKRGDMLITIRRIVAEEGVGAFWKGTAPVIGKQAVNSGVRFTTFGLLQDEVAKRWPDLHGRVGTTLAIGAVSGVVTVYVFCLLLCLECRVLRSNVH